MARKKKKASSKRRRKKKSSRRRSSKGRKSTRRRNKSGDGRTAASRAARELRRGSSEAGQLLGEIGQDIRHEGYRRNPEVEVEEYEGLMANPCGGLQMNPQDIKRRANRLKNV